MSLDPRRIRQFKFTNAVSTDVVYTHEIEGSFNITRLLAAIANGTVPFIRALVPFNQTIIEGIGRADTHEETIATMTEERRETPVVLIMCADGTGFCADGNNRLARRIRDGLEDFLAYIIAFEHREPFRVTTQVQLDNGEWVEADEWEDLTKPILGQHRRDSAS